MVSFPIGEKKLKGLALVIEIKEEPLFKIFA